VTNDPKIFKFILSFYFIDCNFTISSPFHCFSTLAVVFFTFWLFFAHFGPKSRFIFAGFEHLCKLSQMIGLDGPALLNIFRQLRQQTLIILHQKPQKFTYFFIISSNSNIS